jgi:hypothetical protein
MINYSLLESTYKYDVLAENIYGREKEYFHYQLDIDNFNHMLANPIDGLDEGSIRQRMAETLTQQNIVRQIYEALIAQIDNQEAYAAAVARRTTTNNTTE